MLLVWKRDIGANRISPPIYHILDEVIEPTDIRDLPEMKTLCNREVDNSYNLTDDPIIPTCKKCIAVLNARYALSSKDWW